MSIYDISTVKERLNGNPYVGRGIMIGTSKSGKYAAFAYFIMGRSANSRNRIFVEEDGDIYTKPYDESKVQDPSLIIYAAVRDFNNSVIVTNGNQTDSIYVSLENGGTFESALATRQFEPDAPNFTPRISGILEFTRGSFNYKMSILKSIDSEGSACARYYFKYPSIKGLGHFIHTYVTDGNPIPTFQGEPERISIPDSIDDFTNEIWDNLDQDNKISLYVRYTDIETKNRQSRLINKYN